MRALGGFVAGLDKRPALTVHDGWQRGVQLDLPATSVRRLLGVPMAELASRVVRGNCSPWRQGEQLRLHRDERSLVEGLIAPYTYSDMTGAGLGLVYNPPQG